MNKLGWVGLVVLVLLMLAVSPVSAQGGVIPPVDDFETLALVLFFVALVVISIVGVVQVWITTRSMERVTEKVNESIDKVAGFVQSERILSKLERGYEGLTGLRKVLADSGLSMADMFSDLSPSDKDAWIRQWTAEIRDGSVRANSQGVAFKSMPRNDPPPTASGIWKRDMTPLGDLPVSDFLTDDEDGEVQG